MKDDCLLTPETIAEVSYFQVRTLNLLKALYPLEREFSLPESCVQQLALILPRLNQSGFNVEEENTLLDGLTKTEVPKPDGVISETSVSPEQLSIKGASLRCFLTTSFAPQDEERLAKAALALQLEVPESFSITCDLPIPDLTSFSSLEFDHLLPDINLAHSMSSTMNRKLQASILEDVKENLHPEYDGKKPKWNDDSDSLRDMDPFRITEYVQSWMSKLQDAFERNVNAQGEALIKAANGNRATEAIAEKEVRVWFWFPSLSTRQKRDDIVNWALDYNLTGFVLAGKPAFLCLEGTPSSIGLYMADIKSNSWADIPSFQKKVSERYREPLTLGRTFDSMAEITSLIGKGGQKSNRGDMSDVRDYLKSKGLDEAFGNVIGGGTFA